MAENLKKFYRVSANLAKILVKVKQIRVKFLLNIRKSLPCFKKSIKFEVFFYKLAGQINTNNQTINI
jgi:hypothetical protein